MADVDKLVVSIESDSQKAVSGIEALATSLGKLKSATSGGLGLSSIAKGLETINSSVDKMGNVTNKLSGLARAVKELNALGNVKVSASIGNQITKISEALSKLNVGDGATKIQELVAALKPLETLGKSSLGTTVNALNKLPEAIQKIDMKKLHGQVDALTRTFRPLAEEMQKIANGFNAFPSRIQKLIKENNNLSNSNNKTSKSYINLWAKMRMTYNTIKGAANAIGSCINKITKYIEDVNLFNVSMGEFAKEAGEYAEKVGEIMGIDPGEWMRNQGLFMTLATGFGVVNDRAYIMSKNLTQLGYDLSSFFNISSEEAMQKLQSGLAGELEPLRRIGYDLSVARMQQDAYTLGINKKVSAMTQAEKAELRYYAIMKQVTVAQGDMARTLNDPANQLRILTAQVNMAGRAIGSIFIPMLNAVLPYVIAVVKVVRLLAETIASLFGFEMPEVDYSGVKTLASGADDASSALSDAADKAKKLQKYTMGFDELNVIDPNSGSGSGADAGLGGAGFDFELPEYDFLKGVTESKVGTIVEEIKEWLGLTEDIDTWSEFFETRLGRILEMVGLIGGGLLLWKVTAGFLSAITTLTTLLATPTYAIAIGAVLTITGFTIAFTGMKDAVEKGLDGFNFGEIIGGSILGTTGAALLGAKIVEWIGKVCSTKVAFALARLGTNLGVSTTGALGAALGAGIAGIILGIPMYFVGIKDAWEKGLDWLNGILIPAGATAAGAGIGAIIGMLGGPIGAGIGALIGLAIGALTDLIIAIVQNWGTISEWFEKKVIKPVADFFSGLWEDIKKIWEPVATWFDTYVIQPIVGFFSGLWEDIKGIWSTVSTWFNTYVIEPVVSFFEGLFLRIGQFAEGCWLIIRAVWKIVSEWFDENVIQPVCEFFKGLWESVSGFFSDLWEDIKAIWDKVSTWFDENVIQPVVTFFEGVWTDVKEYFSNLWEDIKAVWTVVSTWFDENIIQPVQTLFETVCEKISGFFSNLWLGIKKGVVGAMNAVIGSIESALNWVIKGINKLIGGFNKVVQWAADVLGEDWDGVTLVKEVTLNRIPVPTYEQGGFPTTGEMFIAREAGPEMVGSIGRKTAVANNDQIVEGIAYGVSVANSESNTLLREQNGLLREMLAQEKGVYLDGKSISKSVEKHQRERGRQLVTGGAY